MMNRAQAPEINLIDSLTLPKVEKVLLDNGVEVYLLNEGEQEVIKIELMFKAGKWFEQKNLVADFTNRMLREGTKTRNAKQLADTFDYYGANFNAGAGFETAGASLYSLNKHVDHLLPLLFEIFSESFFPENEAIADGAKAKGVTLAVFDRGGFQYQGVIAALADGAREGGLSF